MLYCGESAVAQLVGLKAEKMRLRRWPLSFFVFKGVYKGFFLGVAKIEFMKWILAVLIFLNFSERFVICK